ncbi:MAG: hypothetical protein PF447_12370 [Spirochaetaceae bacterium]|nr:hypothetical protein [Spirochaetaceae bacterium]
MKFRMNWLILIIALLGFIACDTGTTSTTSTIDDGTTTGDDTTTVSVDRSIQLVDADDTVLGYVINLHTWVGRYDFITENGYIVTIDVMGKYFPYYEDASSGIYFTGEDGTGDVYIQSWSSSVVGEPQFSNFLHYVEGSFYNYKPKVGSNSHY